VSGATAPIAAGPRTLPSGWRWAALGNICDIVIGRTPRRDSPEYWNGSLPWVSISDLNDDVLTDTRERITTLGAEASGARLLASGTLLFSFKLTIGKMAVAGVDLFTNEAIAGLVPKADVQLSTEYLRHALSAVNVSSGSSHAVKGRTLNLPLLRAITIPLAPLREQKRIAAALREQLSAAARMRAATDTQAESAEHLFPTRLALTFDSRDARSWPVATLGDTGEIVSGVTLGRRLNGQATRPVAYLRVANVKDGRLDLAEVYTVEATESEIAKLRLRRGDLLLTEGGDPDKLGRGALWAEQVDECIHQNHIFRLRLDRERFVPEFVSFQLGSRYGKAYFARHAKQTTGIATINQRVLRGFPLMVPPVAVQQRVADDLCAAQAAEASLRNRVEHQRCLADALPASLLRLAFSGGL